MTTSICAGLFVSLLETPIDNDSFVDVNDIGNSDNVNNGLLCLTNATNCCGQPNAQGVWRFPDGTAPPTTFSLGSGTGFSRDRGPSVVRLFRRGNPPERGRFRCELQGDTIYVNVCE